MRPFSHPDLLWHIILFVLLTKQGAQNRKIRGEKIKILHRVCTWSSKGEVEESFRIHMKEKKKTAERYY